MTDKTLKPASVGERDRFCDDIKELRRQRDAWELRARVLRQRDVWELRARVLYADYWRCIPMRGCPIYCDGERQGFCRAAFRRAILEADAADLEGLI